jgi:hypothetical protein
MKRGRIPGKMAAFVTYVIVVNDYLHMIESGATNPRGIILGMTTAELAALDAFALSLMSGDPAHPGIWDLHSHKETKTQVTSADMAKAKKEIGQFFRPLLNRMNTSAELTGKDRVALQLSDPVTTHKTPEKRISEQCFANIKMLGGGDLLFECRFNNDSKRTGKPALADAVEFAWCQEVTASDSTESDSPTVPDPDTVANRSISTKASFFHALGGNYVGKRVHMWFRWINTKHPNLSGSWSVVNSPVVS